MSYAHTEVRGQNHSTRYLYSIARVQFIVNYIVYNCTSLSPCSENTYETVEPKESAALSDHVAMETNPAYASVHYTT